MWPLILITRSRMLTKAFELGMFLFAKLVMENFYKQTNRENLNIELEPNRFPRGLEEAYVISLISIVLDTCPTVLI